MNPLTLLRQRFTLALASLTEEGPKLADMVLPSQDTKFGDYQANCAMSLGKRLGKPPREVAQTLIDQLDLADLCEPPEIAGPGFINLRLREDWLSEQLAQASEDTERLGIEPVAKPRTIVLDYSSPNVAKPMHVGHIRSTVIGDALSRILKTLGHRTITDNHIGDWGKQFGMILYGYKNFLDAEAMQRHPVTELSRLYKKVHDLTSPTPASPASAGGSSAGGNSASENPVAEAILAETAQLHAGDETNLRLWHEFLPPCLEEINATYRRLGVSFDHTLGESFYNDRLARVVQDLLDRKLARESDGAICVFLEGFKAPMIVRKKDGAFLYATTDLATIQYRMETWQPDAILYVVDHRQSFHFKQLFATARLCGCKEIELTHISFGTVLDEAGRPYKTRSGTAIGLVGLLDEAVDRAYQIVCQNDDNRPEPMLSEEERRQVANQIGIGAIKYADLAHNRTSDYVFSYDKMLAMTGNTAAYMQYSYARVRSIFTRGEVDIESLRDSGAKITIASPAERALAMALLRFSETLDRVADDYRPNHLTTYLFDVASRYSEFFENCPVLKAETDELRTSRLLLCDLTARTIERGLSMLGIEVVERM